MPGKQDSPIRGFTPKVVIEVVGNGLLIRKLRPWRGFSVFMVIICSLFIVAACAVLILPGRPQRDALEWIGCLFAIGAAGYTMVAHLHRLRFDVDTTISLQADRIKLNDRWLALKDASHFTLIAAPVRTSDRLRYSIGIQDKSGYNRLFVWFTEKEIADEVLRFLDGAGLRTERIATSWDHRGKDLRWGPGMWQG